MKPRYTAIAGTCPAYLHVSDYKHVDCSEHDVYDIIDERGGITILIAAEFYGTSMAVINAVARASGLKAHRYSGVEYYDDNDLFNAWETTGLDVEREIHLAKAREEAIITQDVIKWATAEHRLIPTRTIDTIDFYDKIELMRLRAEFARGARERAAAAARLRWQKSREAKQRGPGPKRQEARGYRAERKVYHAGSDYELRAYIG